MIGVGGGGFIPPILPLRHAIQHLGSEKKYNYFQKSDPKIKTHFWTSKYTQTSYPKIKRQKM